MSDTEHAPNVIQRDNVDPLETSAESQHNIPSVKAKLSEGLLPGGAILEMTGAFVDCFFGFNGLRVCGVGEHLSEKNKGVTSLNTKFSRA